MREFLTTKEAAELLNLSPRTLSQWRWRGEGPPYVKFGRAVRYEKQDLKKYIEEQKWKGER